MPNDMNAAHSLCVCGESRALKKVEQKKSNSPIIISFPRINCDCNRIGLIESFRNVLNELEPEAFAE